jgi:predicted SAM-dependent methyltransferase
MKQVVLHVGCGNNGSSTLNSFFLSQNWQELRVDIDPEVEPDIVTSITDMKMIEAASVDAIWSSHSLEHIYSHEVPLALGEFHRVIKEDGVLIILVPDLQRVAEIVMQGNLEDTAFVSKSGWPIAPIDIIYGYRRALNHGNLYYAHHTGFTAKTLNKALVQAGFAEILVRRKDFELWALAKKSPSEDTCKLVDFLALLDK